jgi:hypothetical protein
VAVVAVRDKASVPVLAQDPQPAQALVVPAAVAPGVKWMNREPMESMDLVAVVAVVGLETKPVPFSSVAAAETARSSFAT